MIIILSTVFYLLVGSLLVYVTLLLISKGYIDRELENLLPVIYIFWIIVIPLLIMMVPFILVVNLYKKYK